MATFANDTMTGAAGTNLSSHTPDDGGSWTLHASYTGGVIQLSDANRCFSNATGFYGLYWHSGVPATADYDVGIDVVVKSVLNELGIAGRINTGADTFYYAEYDSVNGRWGLDKNIAGVTTLLGSFAQTLTVGNTYALKLTMRGSTISLLVDGVSRVSVTDTEITATGKAGIIANEAQSNTVGLHGDNFLAADPVTTGAFPIFARLNNEPIFELFHLEEIY